jgi:hypothetical protein
MNPDTQGHPWSRAGATILQMTPALRDNPSGNAAADVALAPLQSGARAIGAGEDGPLVNKLRGLGGEFVGRWWRPRSACDRRTCCARHVSATNCAPAGWCSRAMPPSWSAQSARARVLDVTAYEARGARATIRRIHVFAAKRCRSYSWGLIYVAARMQYLTHSKRAGSINSTLAFEVVRSLRSQR